MLTCERRKYCEAGLGDGVGRGEREGGWMGWGMSGCLVELGSWHPGVVWVLCVCVKSEEV